MSRQDQAEVASWIVAIILVVGAVLTMALCGCAEVMRAAPPLLATIGDVLEDELDRAADQRRKKQLHEAQRLLEEVRAAQAAAESAARRATEAAAVAQDAAERAEKAKEQTERARADQALRRLRIRLDLLGLSEKIAKAGQGSEAPAASGADGGADV